jgi:hypothetical protein
MSTSNIRVEPLTEKNWFSWRNKAKAFLQIQGTWRAVEEEPPVEGAETSMASTGTRTAARAPAAPTAEGDEAPASPEESEAASVAANASVLPTASTSTWRSAISFEDLMALDEDARSTTILLVGTEFLHLVTDAATARQAWIALEDYF